MSATYSHQGVHSTTNRITPEISNRSVQNPFVSGAELGAWKNGAVCHSVIEEDSTARVAPISIGGNENPSHGFTPAKRWRGGQREGKARGGTTTTTTTTTRHFTDDRQILQPGGRRQGARGGPPHKEQGRRRLTPQENRETLKMEDGESSRQGRLRVGTTSEDIHHTNADHRRGGASQALQNASRTRKTVVASASQWDHSVWRAGAITTHVDPSFETKRATTSFAQGHATCRHSSHSFTFVPTHDSTTTETTPENKPGALDDPQATARLPQEASSPEFIVPEQQQYQPQPRSRSFWAPAAQAKKMPPPLYGTANSTPSSFSLYATAGGGSPRSSPPYGLHGIVYRHKTASESEITGRLYRLDDLVFSAFTADSSRTQYQEPGFSSLREAGGGVNPPEDGSITNSGENWYVHDASSAPLSLGVGESISLMASYASYVHGTWAHIIPITIARHSGGGGVGNRHTEEGQGVSDLGEENMAVVVGEAWYRACHLTLRYILQEAPHRTYCGRRGDNLGTPSLCGVFLQRCADSVSESSQHAVYHLGLVTQGLHSSFAPASDGNVIKVFEHFLQHRVQQRRVPVPIGEPLREVTMSLWWAPTTDRIHPDQRIPPLRVILTHPLPPSLLTDIPEGEGMEDRNRKDGENVHAATAKGPSKEEGGNGNGKDDHHHAHGNALGGAARAVRGDTHAEPFADDDRPSIPGSGRDQEEEKDRVHPSSPAPTIIFRGYDAVHVFLQRPALSTLRGTTRLPVPQFTENEVYTTAAAAAAARHNETVEQEEEGGNGMSNPDTALNGAEEATGAKEGMVTVPVELVHHSSSAASYKQQKVLRVEKRKLKTEVVFSDIEIPYAEEHFVFVEVEVAEAFKPFLPALGACIQPFLVVE